MTPDQVTIPACPGCGAEPAETIVYRRRMTPAGVALVALDVCLSCCQAELHRLRVAGHEVIGVRDYAF